ncbi:MAG: proline--tRNA ligase [Pseudomonadota bacterium]
MRYSRMLLPTLKEDPAEAEVISHKLMLRAGMIRKLATGIYSYLPLARRTFNRIEQIIREEMDRAGAQEVMLPSVQPSDIWLESGRWNLCGKELLRFKDRNDRDFCLGPTHEEVITDLVRREIRSYRQLPLNLYQIQTKFRDEIRPRFGLMRCREFTMKDAYSFDADESGAEESYNRMFEAYTRIFERCGLGFRAVEADPGAIGGSFSHEFMVMAQSGESAIVSCESCSYAANVEKAEVREPDTNPQERRSARLKGIQKVCTPGMKTVEEVTSFLKVSPEELLKTLIYETDKGTVAVLVRGDHEVNEVKLKNLLDCNYVNLAQDKVIREITRAPMGFAGPVGLHVRIVADSAVREMFNFVTGGNEEDAHLINVNLQDFAVDAFADLRMVTRADPCPRCNGDLRFSRGIEVGHVFKLGTKYSEALRATYLDAHGREQLIIMGCYGIGVGRTVAAAIEQNHDDNGIIFPIPIAPFQVLILPVNLNQKEIRDTSEALYLQLVERGFDVLFDDREESPGIKFKDADLMGIPIRLTVSGRTLKEGMVELKLRKTGEVIMVDKESVLDEIPRHLGGSGSVKM